ncbi:MAG: hypothetical protein GY867_13200 [bacterium]|nr:hypothetical protein [bacterium]
MKRNKSFPRPAVACGKPRLGYLQLADSLKNLVTLKSSISKQAVFHRRAMQDHPRFGCSKPLIGHSSVHILVIRLLCGFLLYALTKSVRLAEKFENVGAMSEPVEQRGRQAFVDEGFIMPLSWIA